MEKLSQRQVFVLISNTCTVFLKYYFFSARWACSFWGDVKLYSVYRSVKFPFSSVYHRGMVYFKSR